MRCKPPLRNFRRSIFRFCAMITPLLGQGGVDAPSKKWFPSFEGAAGVVRSTTDNRWLEPTTPSAPAQEAARHFADGRSHPSLAKEGNFARPKISSLICVSSRIAHCWAQHPEQCIVL